MSRFQSEIFTFVWRELIFARVVFVRLNAAEFILRLSIQDEWKIKWDLIDEVRLFGLSEVVQPFMLHYDEQDVEIVNWVLNSKQQLPLLCSIHT